jgi:hypothetical protein
VYVLPNTAQCREDFEWIRGEIVALGGEATVFAADAISVGGTEDIEAVFRRTREQEFLTLKREIDRLLPAGKGQRLRPSAKDQLRARTPRALRERFNALERIDFFETAVRADTAASLLALERALQGPIPSPVRSEPALKPASFLGRRWVTRPRPGVDRMASAWLIRRFIDPAAAFAFVEDPAESDVSFDMYTGEFSHYGNLCTFEVLADRFGLDTQAVSKIGRLVHDIDIKDAKYGSLEAPAIGRIVDGLRALHSDDGTLLEQGIAVFDALARSFESDEPGCAPRVGLRATRGARRRRN